MRAILVSAAGNIEIEVDSDNVPQGLKHMGVQHSLSDCDGSGPMDRRAFHFDQQLSESEAKRLVALAYFKP